MLQDGPIERFTVSGAFTLRNLPNMAIDIFGPVVAGTP